mmetsp:Transcript_9924/g.32827  ORF Transcript_9924/g.32827 Transcript_9924/m.32827 type:complete len:206 (+) Transcript_9924:2464-3081(+)
MPRAETGRRGGASQCHRRAGRPTAGTRRTPGTRTRTAPCGVPAQLRWVAAWRLRRARASPGNQARTRSASCRRRCAPASGRAARPTAARAAPASGRPPPPPGSAAAGADACARRNCATRAREGPEALAGKRSRRLTPRAVRRASRAPSLYRQESGWTTTALLARHPAPVHPSPASAASGGRGASPPPIVAAAGWARARAASAAGL